MDVVRFKGGLGNQMFQYAFYQALQSRGRIVKASLGYYNKNPAKMQFCLTATFPNINLDYISDEEFAVIDSAWREIKCKEEVVEKFLQDYENRFFWVEETDFHYCPDVFRTQNCTFVGYWQSEKYFDSIRSFLLNSFEFAYGEDKLNILKRRFFSGKNYVAVHIRRGDYLQDPDVWGKLSESNFYYEAINIIKKKVFDPQLVFFSDDIQWVKRRYKYNNAIYIEENMFTNYRSWYDMCLMSNCTHNIIANSSFSWWGAWLNIHEDKIVIAPKKWFFDGRGGEDICPDNWIRI